MTAIFHIICSHQYQILQNQKAFYIVHILDGAARNFQAENFHKGMNYSKIVEFMASGYISGSRQLQVKPKLETLGFIFFMQERKISDLSEGLTTIVAQNNELVPRCKPYLSTEAHKVEFTKKTSSNLKIRYISRLKTSISKVNHLISL